MAMFVGTGALTVTVNVPVFVGSVTLVAVTITCVRVVTAGGVNTPELEIAPALAVHVTVCDGEFVPLTTAEHADVVVPATVAGEHVTETPVTVAGFVVTVIVALADFVVSATDVAVSVTVAGEGTDVGAV